MYQREVNVVRALAKHYQGTVPVIPTIFTPAHCIPEFCGGIEQARYYMDNHPEAVDAMLRALVQTELQLVDAYIEAGADGFFFFAQRYSNADILSEQEFERFCRPYDEMLLARAHGRTWFNMVHVHGAKNFFWDQFKTYDVQALSWENTPQQIPEEERSTVAKVRAVTDKILITGTDQFHDFYGNRQEVLDRFRRRVERAARWQPRCRWQCWPAAAAIPPPAVLPPVRPAPQARAAPPVRPPVPKRTSWRSSFP